MSGPIIDIKEKGSKKAGTIAIIVIIAILVLIVAFNSFCSINAGHTGVVTTFGQVSDTILSEGLHTKIPFIQKVVLIDNRILKTEAEFESASKDLQTVSGTIAVNYCVDKADSAKIYQTIGIDFDEKIVKPAIQESVKSVTARYTAEELITERQLISTEMQGALMEKINPYGLDVKIFNIITFQFSDEFNRAIEAKQTAQQNALKAQQDLERVKVEAQQEIEKAKADAETYKLKNLEITDKNIIMEYINKWDGKLPMVTSDGQFILDLESLIKNIQKQDGTSGSQPVQNNNNTTNTDSE